MLLFPVTLNYFSPYLVVESAAQGIVNGSLIVFVAMFGVSLFLGRAWCGWLCPGAGIQDGCISINNSRVRGGKLDLIKWAIWVPWVAGIGFAALLAGGYRAVNPLYSIESGISVDEPSRYLMYYLVVALFVATPLIAGRRAACHYFCWMAPFMILGRSLRDRFGWPALGLRADSEKCGDCKSCNATCPMSLDVNRMVKSGHMENAECILCGTCVDGCPKRAIAYTLTGS